MSHGDPGYLYCRDEKYPTTELWSHFTGDKCHSLIGKPKLFFIQVKQHILTYFTIVHSLHLFYQRTPFIFFSVALRPNAGHGLLILEVSRSHTTRTTVGRTPLDEWSDLRRNLYLTTHNTHNRQTSMPPVGFEPMISGGERPQTYALDRAATGTGSVHHLLYQIKCTVLINVVLSYSSIFPTRCNVTQFILSGNCSTCFGWYLHPSSGAQTPVSTASVICHTVTATCRYNGR